MNRVIRIDERLASLPKPGIVASVPLRLEPADTLIVCAGFEDRSIAALCESTKHSSGFTVIIISYLPEYKDNQLDAVGKMCSAANCTMQHLVYDRKNPAGFGERLSETVGTTHGHVFIDISGMSRLLIVQAIVALCDSREMWHRCSIIYCEAKSYPPSQEDVEAEIQRSDTDPMFAALFLSSGVVEVTVVPELSPESLGASQTRLVVFPSFNTDQLSALRRELQPSRISFIHGFPPDLENQWRLQALARLNHIDESTDSRRICTSTYDYRETLNYLLSLYAEFSIRERILISPTGSKMQSVAVALFRAFVHDVQIVYPTPREFRTPKEYTTGVGELHVLSLANFGSLCE